jgi:hypothetical protein
MQPNLKYYPKGTDMVYTKKRFKRNHAEYFMTYGTGIAF